jgi:hypothetical protein
VQVAEMAPPVEKLPGAHWPEQAAVERPVDDP